MSDKVKIPREIADCIEAMRKVKMGNFAIIAAIANQSFPPARCIYEWMNTEIKDGTIATAIINGYEVEETVEDQVRELYNTYRTTNSDDRLVRIGIYNTIILLAKHYPELKGVLDRD